MPLKGEAKRRASRRWYWRKTRGKVTLPCCYKVCGKESTWHDPDPRCRWSACDKHKIPGDVRIHQ